MLATATQIMKEKLEAKSQRDCEDQSRELDEALRESAMISSEPIRSGIGFKDFIQMVREGVEYRRSKDR